MTKEVEQAAGTAGNKTAIPFKTKDGRMRVAVREGKKDGQPQRWRQAVEAVVQEQARSGAPLLDGPIVAWVCFYLPKPKSAPKSRRVWPDRKPDLSKLLRAIEDPMKGKLIADDARIVRFARLEKVYVEDVSPFPYDARPRAEVMLWLAEGALAVSS